MAGRIDISGFVRALREYTQQFQPNYPVQLAEYVSDAGDGYHVVDVLNPDGSPGPRTRVRGRVRAWPGVIVRLSHNPQIWGDELAIMGADEAGYGGSSAPSMLELHGEDHGYGQPDETANLHTWQIYPLRVQPSSGNTVAILAGNYRCAGGYRSLQADTTSNLAAYVAALGAGEKQFLTLSIDAASNINVTEGAVKANPQSSDIADPPVGDAPLAAVLIEQGQTSVVRADLYYDLRYIPGPWTGGGGSTSGEALWVNVVIVAEGGGEYDTIQAAENVRAAEDVIAVMPGSYAENLEFTTQGAVVATFGAEEAGNTIVTGNDDIGPMIRFDLSRAIKGLYLTRTLSGGAGEYIGLDADDAGEDPSIVECRVNLGDGATGRDLTGISVSANTTVYVTRCRVILSGAGTNVALGLEGGTIIADECEFAGDVVVGTASDLYLRGCYVDGDVTGIAGSDLYVGQDTHITGTISGWDNITVLGNYVIDHDHLGATGDGGTNVALNVGDVLVVHSGDTRSGDYYNTIAAALAVAGAGDTILLGPGDYAESFTMVSNVSLIGQDWSRTRISGTITFNAAITGAVVKDVAIGDGAVATAVSHTSSGTNYIFDCRIWGDGGGSPGYGINQSAGTLWVVDSYVEADGSVAIGYNLTGGAAVFMASYAESIVRTGGTFNILNSAYTVAAGTLVHTAWAYSVRDALLTVDGSGSGLDADLLDSYHASVTPATSQIPVVDGSDNIVLPGKISLASVAGVATNGYVWRDSTQKAIQTFTDGIEQTLVGCLFTQTANATVANTTTETTLIGSGVGTVTLPANFFVAGKTIRGFMRGYNSTANPAGTLTLRVKLGGTTICATGTNTATNGLSNRAFDLQFTITCRTVGAAGTVMAQGTVIRATSATSSVRWEMVKTATVTVDTTGALALDITAQWGTASASNTITSTNLFVNALN